MATSANPTAAPGATFLFLSPLRVVPMMPVGSYLGFIYLLCHPAGTAFFIYLMPFLYVLMTICATAVHCCCLPLPLAADCWATDVRERDWPRTRTAVRLPSGTIATRGSLALLTHAWRRDTPRALLLTRSAPALCACSLGASAPSTNAVNARETIFLWTCVLPRTTTGGT